MIRCGECKFWKLERNDEGACGISLPPHYVTHITDTTYWGEPKTHTADGCDLGQPTTPTTT
jgi:hypothetical protein